MQTNYDVVIVGSGIAGLYAALNLDRSLRVLLVCKGELTLSNSSLAQGGIAAVIDTENDSSDAHFNDTLIAGGFKNNADAVRILVNEGPDDVRRIIDYGVNFDCDTNGGIHFTLEGGHSKPRILHHEDSTGREMVDKLILAVQNLPNVTICEKTLVCDMKKGRCFHFNLLQDGVQHTVNSLFCILATGGIGRVYEYTTNSKIATGDGIALAHQLGAKIKNLHLIQFHPTGFANKQTRETFLISESVRGEGAFLRNVHGDRFMQDYDDRLELAPRDVVSRAIMAEAKKTDSDDFYLDITHQDADFVKSRFPMIYENLFSQGYDMTKDCIPIFPCHHYLMGGIDVNTDGLTSIDRLYAAGECSHTGVHGNNRLASNSLLEALVFSRRAAHHINELMKDMTEECSEATFSVSESTTKIPTGIRTEVRSIMQRAYFVIPNQEDAMHGFEEILAIKKQLDSGQYCLDIDFVEAKSLVTIAYLILKEVI